MTCWSRTNRLRLKPAKTCPKSILVEKTEKWDGGSLFGYLALASVSVAALVAAAINPDARPRKGRSPNRSRQSIVIGSLELRGETIRFPGIELGQISMTSRNQDRGRAPF